MQTSGRSRQPNPAKAVAADARLARLKAEIAADEQKRIEQAAQKYSGLTFPPEEELTPEPEDVRPPSGKRARPRSQAA